MLRIRDILVLIRIRISGSVPLTNGSGFGSGSDSGSGSYYFRQWPSRRQLKIFVSKFFCLLLFEATFKSFFKLQVKKKSQNSRKIRWYKDPDPYLVLMDPDPGGPKTSGSESAALIVPNVPDIPDSFYEILLKSFIMYGDTADVTKFNESYQKETSRNWVIKINRRFVSRSSDQYWGKNYDFNNLMAQVQRELPKGKLPELSNNKK